MSEIHGIGPLIALRKIHRKPELVFLFVGDYKPCLRFPWHLYGDTPELIITQPNPRVDLRPLVGLAVIMLARSLTAEVFAIFDRLKALVDSVMLHIEDFGEDVDSVIVWDKTYGQRTMGDVVHG